MRSGEDRQAEDRRRAESTRDFNEALGDKNHGMVRWLLGIRPPGAADAMVNEVLCKFICHNICCVIMEQCELVAGHNRSGV